MTTLIPKFDFKNGGTTPTGAVNRSIYNKLAETVSVMDFGAVADGTTDDSAAFQAAIDYVGGLTNGGMVVFPTGTYYQNATVRLKNNVTLSGYGATIKLGAWLATAGGTTGAFVTYSGSTLSTPSVPTATSNICVYGLTINGQTTGISGQSIPNANMQGAIFVFGGWGDNTPSSPTYWQTIQFTNYVVQDCYMENFAGAGVLSYNGKQATISQNRFTNFFSNVALSSGAPVNLQGTSDAIITNNRIEHDASGYSWHGVCVLDWDASPVNVVVSNNIMNGLNQGNGISTEGNATGSLAQGIISSNVISNCSGGINATNCTEITIDSNIMQSTSGIFFNDTTTLYITNNQLNTINGDAIRGGGAGILRVTVANNRIQNTNYADTTFQGVGIYLPSITTATLPIITGNTLKDIDSGAIVVEIDNVIITDNVIFNAGRNATASIRSAIRSSYSTTPGIVANNRVISAGNTSYGYDGSSGNCQNLSGNSFSGSFTAKYRLGYRNNVYVNATYSQSKLSYDGYSNTLTYSDTTSSSNISYIGDIVNNTAPASAGYIGFVCTVSGNPGTWKTFGLIS